MSNEISKGASHADLLRGTVTAHAFWSQFVLPGTVYAVLRGLAGGQPELSGRERLLVSRSVDLCEIPHRAWQGLAREIPYDTVAWEAATRGWSCDTRARIQIAKAAAVCELARLDPRHPAVVYALRQPEHLVLQCAESTSTLSLKENAHTLEIDIQPSGPMWLSAESAKELAEWLDNWRWGL